MGNRKKFYRYMSQQEFIKYMRGQTLKNSTDFSEVKLSTSKGFCFLGEKTIADGEEYEPGDAFAFLRGIVSGEVLVEFEADEDLFTPSQGIYNNPNTWEKMSVNEFCINEYNLETLKPLRYATNEVFLEESTPFANSPCGFRPDWKDYTEYFRDEVFNDAKKELDDKSSKTKDNAKEDI